MARFSSLRHPRQRLLDPYRPCDLCLADLFPPATLRGASARFGYDSGEDNANKQRTFGRNFCRCSAEDVGPIRPLLRYPRARPSP